MKIAIGSDNAGFGLKEFLKGKLIEAGYEVEDLGTLRRDAEIRYMDAADRVAKAVQSGAAARGILCCGTGMGMSICANKHKGIYCAVVESQWAAYNCRFINNANEHRVPRRGGRDARGCAGSAGGACGRAGERVVLKTEDKIPIWNDSRWGFLNLSKMLDS